jgi:peptidoglycan/xylan/chitin deacetylase (PgdA/CDA1 family)
MLKTLLGVLSPGGQRARLSVLIFHRVLPEPDAVLPNEVDARRFDEICSWLAGFANVLPLDEAVRLLKEGRLPSRAMAITFDDGYADNHDVVLPILLRHGLTSTFFISTGFVGSGCMWNDAVTEAVRHSPLPSLPLTDLSVGFEEAADISTADAKRSVINRLIDRLKYLPTFQRVAISEQLAATAKVDIPKNLMMSVDQIRRLRKAGMQIGAHTVSHPILANLDRPLAAFELEESKRHLEEMLDEPITLFAYPNGRRGVDFNEESVALSKELGFKAAVTTDQGAANRETDCFLIPRFTPWDRTRTRFVLRLVHNLRRDVRAATA